jgi:hypothetical protein
MKNQTTYGELEALAKIKQKQDDLNFRNVKEVKAVCSYCKEVFTDLLVTGESIEPDPMCDNCLKFADEEFRQYIEK